MARRQQLLGALEQPSGRKRSLPPAPDTPSPRYPPETKAKAYAAFLDGAGWSDCARAIGHNDPNGSGAQLIIRWAEEDHWQRPSQAGDYKAKVEQERDTDPQRISNEIDQLCVKMQKVSEKYIEQFVDEETGAIMILPSFKTRDFADMAAALRMIHETRIKIRKSNETKDGDKDGKKNDFLSMIRDAGLSRLRDNRRRTAAPAVEEEEDVPEEEQHDRQAEETQGETSEIPSIADIRSRLESESAGNSGAP